MSKKKKLREANIEIFNTKEFFVKYAKRYGIVLLFSVPIIAVLNYVFVRVIKGYNGTVVFFASFAMLLFACLIGLIIFTKKDEKEKMNSSKEKERDPFAD